MRHSSEQRKSYDQKRHGSSSFRFSNFPRFFPPALRNNRHVRKRGISVVGEDNEVARSTRVEETFVEQEREQEKRDEVNHGARGVDGLRDECKSVGEMADEAFSQKIGVTVPFTGDAAAFRTFLSFTLLTSPCTHSVVYRASGEPASLAISSRLWSTWPERTALYSHRRLNFCVGGLRARGTILRTRLCSRPFRPPSPRPGSIRPLATVSNWR